VLIVLQIRRQSTSGEAECAVREKWWFKLIVVSLAGCSPVACLIGLCTFPASFDYLPAWVALSACCGVVAGVVYRFWSVAGALLALGLVSAIAYRFGDFSHDGGIILMLGVFVWAAYLGGLPLGVLLGYLLRWFLKRPTHGEEEERQLPHAHNALLND